MPFINPDNDEHVVNDTLDWSNIVTSDTIKGNNMYKREDIEYDKILKSV